jgi:hypothetical protein
MSTWEGSVPASVTLSHALFAIVAVVALGSDLFPYSREAWEVVASFAFVACVGDRLQRW